jgi:hypothetical protein
VNIELTKDADVLICLVFKSYSEKRSNGLSKTLSNDFGDSETFHKAFVPKWHIDDVYDICAELHRADLMYYMWASGIFLESRLTDNGIIYMENRFERNITKLLDYIKKLPFV